MKQPENSIDYLVIGDSEKLFQHLSDGDLDQTRIAGYNCGVVGQQAQYTYYLLEEVLQKQDPQVVILETNELFRRAGALRSWNPRRKIWRRNIFLCSSITTAGNGSVSARFRHLSRLKRPLPLPM